MHAHSPPCFQELDCRLVAYFGDKAVIDGLGKWLPRSLSFLSS